jgi:hypothetical protein
LAPGHKLREPVDEFDRPVALIASYFSLAAQFFGPHEYLSTGAQQWVGAIFCLAHIRLVTATSTRVASFSANRWKVRKDESARKLADTQNARSRLYPSRVARRDRIDWHTGCLAASSDPIVARGGAPNLVSQSPQTNWQRTIEFRICKSIAAEHGLGIQLDW